MRPKRSAFTLEVVIMRRRIIFSGKIPELKSFFHQMDHAIQMQNK